MIKYEIENEGDETAVINAGPTILQELGKV